MSRRASPERRRRAGGIRLIGVLVTGLLLLGYFFVGDSGDEEPRPERGGTITVALAGDLASASLNGLTHDGASSATIAQLTQGPLVRQNPATRALEPWLARRWDTSADGRTITLQLRRELVWSDEAPFTSADVRFTIETALDPASRSPLAPRFTTAAGTAAITTPHDYTVIIRMPPDTAGALAAVVDLPIYPAHALREARAAGRLHTVWDGADALDAFAGTGPFVPRSREPGRLVLERNPHYWRTDEEGARLPYLDGVVLQAQGEAGQTVAQLEAGGVDVLAAPLGLEEYPEARRAERGGTLAILEGGVATRPYAFWFCLAAGRDRDPRWAFVRRTEFRQALSHAVDREQFAQTVFFGQAVPVWGAVTPGSPRYFNPNVPRYPPDAALVGDLMAQAGLQDRNGDLVLEHASGAAARFDAIAPDEGRLRDAAAALTQALAPVGVAIDVRFLPDAELQARLAACDYEMALAPIPPAVVDSGVNLEFWLSSGGAHVWNPGQAAPATEWEAAIDALMVQYADGSGDTRRELFHEAQRILGEAVPVVALAAPRLFFAHRASVRGLVAAAGQPPLWNVDSVFVSERDKADTAILATRSRGDRSRRSEAEPR